MQYNMEIIFSETICNFLKNYKPASQMFTSEDEADLISETLNLCELSFEERCQIRNEVVRYYTELMDAEVVYENGEYKGRTNKFWDLMQSMQSVTTVIDYYKYQKLPQHNIYIKAESKSFQTGSIPFSFKAL